jgi:hypothetical protein
MARTKTTIIIDYDGTTMCNDPEAEIEVVDLRGTGSQMGEPDGEGDDHCGCCGAYHRPGWAGDCRDDDERFFAMGSINVPTPERAS